MTDKLTEWAKQQIVSKYAVECGDCKSRFVAIHSAWSAFFTEILLHVVQGGSVDSLLFGKDLAEATLSFSQGQGPITHTVSLYKEVVTLYDKHIKEAENERLRTSTD